MFTSSRKKLLFLANGKWNCHKLSLLRNGKDRFGQCNPGQASFPFFTRIRANLKYITLRWGRCKRALQLLHPPRYHFVPPSLSYNLLEKLKNFIGNFDFLSKVSSYSSMFQMFPCGFSNQVSEKSLLHTFQFENKWLRHHPRPRPPLSNCLKLKSFKGFLS